ncbi:MAG TPA: ATP-binding protein, partial [Methanocorpusculum sp.]|nr:ATP-binding protein [Methanocorpusculum sp.]
MKIQEIPRNRYLTSLIERKQNTLIKVITGIRRCGKSYLMNRLFYRHLRESGVDEAHIIRFAFDSAEDLQCIGEDLLTLARENRPVSPEKFMTYIAGKIRDDEVYYLLLDEVQNLGAFETVLNSYLRHENLDIYVTGSNSKFLSNDVLTEFAGRGDEIHIYPLSFSEYYATCRTLSPLQAFDTYMRYGGLPFTASLPSEEQKTAYLAAQMNNVFLKDIIMRHHILHTADLEELVNTIASGMSMLTNPSRLAHTFQSVKGSRLSAPTIETYLSYLEDAFLIRRVTRFDIRGMKYINTPYKIYFEDTGLRNARLAFRQIERTYLMENIIYNELRIRGFQVDVGVVFTRETTADGNDLKKQLEIDFVANKGNQRYYIQSAWMMPDAMKECQELRPFNLTQDSFKKILILGTEMKPWRNEKGYVI